MSATGRFVSSAPTKVSSIPIFLAPAFLKPAQTIFPAVLSSRTFSSSTARSSNHRRSGETNKKRGESAIRRTGPRTTQGRWDFPLPEPVFRERVAQPADYTGTDSHGLWQFFDSDKKAMVEPQFSAQHGQPSRLHSRCLVLTIDAQVVVGLGKSCHENHLKTYTSSTGSVSSIRIKH